MGTIASLRKNYPWLAYGNEYDVMKSELKYFDWLINKLENEKPGDRACHEVRSCVSHLSQATEQYKKLFEKLPEPTGEQRNGNYDPFIEGLWPEDRLEDIENAWFKMQVTKDVAKRAADSLVRSEYAKEILHDKVCKSIKEIRKTRRGDRK